MKKFTTLIPLQRNDGTPVGPEELQEILDRITSTFGGATMEDAVVEGMWTDPDTGKIFRDKLSRVSVAIEGSRMQEAKALVVEIGKLLGQEAMYFETSETEVTILKVPK